MLKELTLLNATAGQEEEVRNFILQTVGTDNASVDAMGNLMIQNGDGGKTLLVAHLDEPGLIVTKITEDGYLKFDVIGKLNPATLISKRVTVNGLPGVIGIKAVHLTTKEEREKNPKVQDLFLDIGAKNKEEAAAVVCPGDRAIFDSKYTDFGTSYIKSKALRSRTGCAILCKLIKESNIPFTAIFTTQKEVRGRGAETAVQNGEYSKAIVLDCIACTDTQKTSPDNHIKLGGGPVLSVTQTEKSLQEKIKTLADRYDIPLQSDADTEQDPAMKNIMVAGNGIPGVLLKIPCRYMDSCSNVIDKRDYMNCIKLLKLFLEEEQSDEAVK